MFADRGKEEVVIPEGALVWANAFRLHLAEISVMQTKTISKSVPMQGSEDELRRFERTVRMLFTEAVIRGKYDELIADFTKRMLLR